MSATTSYKRIFSARNCLLWMVVLIVSLAACTKSGKNEGAQSAGAAAGQQTFSSQEEAGTALLEAAKSGDQQKLLAIFGPNAESLISTGDSVKDKNIREAFVDGYNQMHRWGTIKAGGEVLYVGADNYPFPIPLGHNKDGRWYFDTAAGKDEILARRIGNGELNAIAAVQVIADAQQKYFNQTHDGIKQYAQQFVSDEGKHNGLYWPVQKGQPSSPLGPAAEFAKALGYTNAGNGAPQPFNGYYFKILTKQGDTAKGGAKDYIVNGKMTGGFAILAYPARYRDSGIMTFMIDRDGVLYQKDLGEKTEEQSATVVAFNPGDGWNAVTGSANPGPAQEASANRHD